MSDLSQKSHPIWAWFIGLPIGLVCLMVAAWLAYGLYRTHMATVEREKAVAREAEETARWMREKERESLVREEQLAKLKVQEEGRKIKEDIARMKQAQEKERQLLEEQEKREQERQREKERREATAKEAKATAKVQPFVGRWKLVNDKGVPSSYLTVTSDFTALRDHARNYPGRWEVVGNEARFTWEDGYRDIMRLENGEITFFGLGKVGTAWGSRPNFRLRAVRIAD
jgi:TolA-binding protein